MTFYGLSTNMYHNQILRVSTVSLPYPPLEIDTPGDLSVFMDHLCDSTGSNPTVSSLDADGSTGDTPSSPVSRMGTRSNPQLSINPSVGTRSARTRRELNSLAYPVSLHPDVFFFAKANLADIYHQEWFMVVKHAYTATNTQLRGTLDSDRTIVIHPSFREAMGLPAADQ